MRKKTRVFAAGLAISFFGSVVVSCIYPVAPSAQCRDTVSACLEQCAPMDPEPMVGDGKGQLIDRRSPCEKSCHTKCGSVK